MHKGISALLVSLSLLSSCAPRFFETTQASAEQTAGTLGAQQNNAGSDIFDENGNLTSDTVHIEFGGRIFLLISCNKEQK